MKIAKSFLIVSTLAAAPFAMADHNSPWGEGWANMPNDIHNTRIETRELDDNDAFIDFVRQGGGADSINDAVPVARGAGGMGGGGRGGRS